MNSRRGRPPAYDRDAALRAIVETFRLRGYAAASLDEIAKATGMNRPSLFAAFGNKKAMYMAALESYRGQMMEAVGAVLERPGPLPDVTADFFAAAIDFYCKGAAPGCLVLCTASAEAPADADIRKVLADVIAEIECQIEQRIERAISERKTCPVNNAAALSKLLSALLIAIAIQARTGARQAELKAFANTVITATFAQAADFASP